MFLASVPALRHNLFGVMTPHFKTGYTVLVVDDDPAVLATYRRLLEIDFIYPLARFELECNRHISDCEVKTFGYARTFFIKLSITHYGGIYIQHGITL